jgi:hypothetical protein
LPRRRARWTCNQTARHPERNGQRHLREGDHAHAVPAPVQRPPPSRTAGRQEEQHPFPSVFAGGTGVFLLSPARASANDVINNGFPGPVAQVLCICAAS